MVSSMIHPTTGDWTGTNNYPCHGYSLQLERVVGYSRKLYRKHDRHSNIIVGHMIEPTGGKCEHECYEIARGLIRRFKQQRGMVIT